MTNIIVHDQGDINITQKEFSRGVLFKRSASFFWSSCNAWLPQHDWNSQVQPRLAGHGFSSWEPQQGCIHYKESDSSNVFNHLAVLSTASVMCVWGGAPPCPSQISVLSLRRGLSHHLDAVLLELCAQQGILVLQLLNLLSAQLVVNVYPLHFLQTLLQSLVALPQLSDVVTCFGEDAPFACSCLCAVHVTVWDDLGQSHNPIVDFVSSPSFNFIMLRSPPFISWCSRSVFPA